MSGIRVRSAIFGGDSPIEFTDPSVTVGFEVRPNDDGTIDEVLISVAGQCVFHLEQLDDDAYWFAFYGGGDGTNDRHFDVRRRKRDVRITER